MPTVPWAEFPVDAGAGSLTLWRDHQGSGPRPVAVLQPTCDSTELNDLYPSKSDTFSDG